MCKVSVIVPVYNVEKYLRACLESLAAQTLDDIEIIVVNDGSTDGSLAIAEEFAAKYPWFRVLSTENKGVSHARNYGAQLSQGGYLAFVDGDDEVEPDYCKAMYEKAARDGNDMVMCRADHIMMRSGQIQRVTYPDTFWEEDNFRFSDHAYLLTRLSRGPWNKLVHRDLFFRTQFPEDLRDGEDWTFVIKAFCLAVNIGTVKSILYHHYYFHGGVTNRAFDLVRQERIASLEQIRSFMEKNGFFETFQLELEWFCVYIVDIFSSTIVKKDAFTWYARLCYIQRAYEFLRQNYPYWRKNYYYKKKAEEEARRFRPFRFKYYGKTHLLMLLYLSSILPEILYKQVLRADHVLVFVCRWVRWELLGNIERRN